VSSLGGHEHRGAEPLGLDRIRGEHHGIGLEHARGGHDARAAPLHCLDLQDLGAEPHLEPLAEPLHNLVEAAPRQSHPGAALAVLVDEELHPAHVLEIAGCRTFGSGRDPPLEDAAAEIEPTEIADAAIIESRRAGRVLEVQRIGIARQQARQPNQPQSLAKTHAGNAPHIFEAAQRDVPHLALLRDGQGHRPQWQPLLGEAHLLHEGEQAPIGLAHRAQCR
jgi:hypothetical protein